MELKQCLRLRHGLSSTTVHPQEHSYPLESATGVLSLEEQLYLSVCLLVLRSVIIVVLHTQVCMGNY